MRKHRRRISTFLIVTGSLCLVIGTLFALAALFQYEFNRWPFVRVGLFFAAGGAVCFLIRFLAITLPELIAERRSDSNIRRREFFKNTHRPIRRRHRRHGRPDQLASTPDDTNGSVLILTLVLLGVVSALAVQVIGTARSAAAEASAHLRNNLLRVAVIDTARTALQQLADDPDLNVDHLAEPWNEPREIRDPAGLMRRVRTVDAQRAFDLNNLAVETTGDTLPPSEALAQVMLVAGHFTPGERVEAARDWIDANAAGPHESDFYRTLPEPYDAANRIAWNWSEVFLVHGWSPALLDRKPGGVARRGLFSEDLVDMLTLLPVTRNRVVPLNINTADGGALRALLGPEQETLVNSILTARKETPYAQTDFLALLLGEDAYRQIAPYLDVRSRYFFIEAEAHDGDRAMRLHLLAARDDRGGVEVVQATF